jgi:hypothetical protein
MAVRLGGEKGILLLLVIHDQRTVRMGCYEQVLRPREPFYVSDGGGVNHAIFVDPSVLLRHGLIPNNVARRRSHHNVQMR